MPVIWGSEVTKLSRAMGNTQLCANERMSKWKMPATVLLVQSRAVGTECWSWLHGLAVGLRPPRGAPVAAQVHSPPLGRLIPPTTAALPLLLSPHPYAFAPSTRSPLRPTEQSPALLHTPANRASRFHDHGHPESQVLRSVRGGRRCWRRSKVRPAELHSYPYSAYVFFRLAGDPLDHVLPTGTSAALIPSLTGPYLGPAQQIAQG